MGQEARSLVGIPKIAGKLGRFFLPITLEAMEEDWVKGRGKCY